MKKISVVLLSLAVLFCTVLTACIYDDPEPEIRPKQGLVVATAAGSVEATISEDGSSATALLTQSSDAGLVLYLYEDKGFASENAVVSYEYSYAVKTWAASSPNPKLMVRYGDGSSSWKNYDPSYSEKTKYEDCSGKTGSYKGSITLKSAANAIVFATNGYQWAGDSKDTIEITVTKISVSE